MEQLNLFEVLYEKYKIKKPIRLIELFGGIGSQAKALKNLNANFEHYKLVEYDKYPVASYNAIHGTNFIPTDITKIHAKDLEIIDRDKYEYIMTYSFPCQDLSLAGKGKGMCKGSGTRSGLLWEVERLINELGTELPQILLLENVPQVMGKKNIEDFKAWQTFLESKGYTNFVQLLNAKDYGVPQNRNRCFMVSILGNYTYTFPQPTPLKLKLKDMLEQNVDEKYFLSDKMLNYIIANNEKWTGNNDKSIINKSIASTINTGEGSRRCDASNYICDELEENTNIKLLKQSKILIKNATEKGYLEATDGDGVDISGRMEYHRGTVQKGLTQTLTTKGGDNNGVVVGLRIRKLTPKECWRLMDFDDEDFNKAAKINSNTQLYKQAGNSIVVAILEAIFKQLL